VNYPFKPYKAPGPGDLRGRVLKLCANELTDSLTKLFQFLSDLQIVLNTWKLSFIQPLLKNEIKKCSPVSLTSILTKSMERVRFHAHRGRYNC